MKTRNSVDSSYLTHQINSKQNYKGRVIEFDTDASPEVWEFYKQVYSAERWGLLNEFNFDDLKLDGNRIFSYLNKDSILASDDILSNKFKLGGETDFNFNKKYYPYLEKILIKSGSNEELFEKLSYCKEMYHSLLNFSLMPATGGLNNFKGQSRYFDRLDIFFNKLNQYYETENIKILNISNRNEKFKKNYLDTFDDIYDYCRKIYFIYDENLIMRIISNSNNTLQDEDGVLKYMNIAMDFWKEKENIILKHTY